MPRDSLVGYMRSNDTVVHNNTLTAVYQKILESNQRASDSVLPPQPNNSALSNKCPQEIPKPKHLSSLRNTSIYLVSLTSLPFPGEYLLPATITMVNIKERISSLKPSLTPLNLFLPGIDFK